MFKQKFIGDKTVYCSDILDAEHFFTSRELIVKDNVDLIREYLNVKELIRPGQTHSDNIKIVGDCVDYEDTDALILSVKNIAIYLNFADCTPVILYDNVKNIGSVVHAGWRGTAKQIVQKTVIKMNDVFKSNPGDISAVIGPCISFDEFETYDEALEQLRLSVKKTDGLFRGHYADLKGINAQQLRELGVKKIDICPYCTVKDNDKFFSYRKENKTLLRHSAVLKIK